MSNSLIRFHSKFVLKQDDDLKESRPSFGIENVQPTWYNNLPVPILVNIFQYFDEGELARSIIPVCRHWKYAALKPVLWKKLFFRGSDIPVNHICSKIRMCPNLESLYVERINDPITVVRQVCRCVPTIKKLAIRHCPPLPETVVRYIIASCKDLECLDMSGTEFKGSVVYKEFSALAHLKKLNLGGNQHLNIRNLLTAVLNCRNLVDLRISNYVCCKDQLRDEDASLIVSHFSDKLISLSLDSSTLSNLAFQSIFSCSKLQRLGLYGATNLPGDLFIQLWKRLPNLTKLKIKQGHQISEANIVDVFTSGASVMEKLTVLDFSGCWKIADGALEVITQCCPELQSLGLKSCKMVTNLTPVSARCANLTKLNVAFTSRLNGQTIFPLPRKLHVILIDEAKIYEGLTKELNKSYPGVNILVCLSEYNKNVKQFV